MPCLRHKSRSTWLPEGSPLQTEESCRKGSFTLEAFKVVPLLRYQAYPSKWLAKEPKSIRAAEKETTTPVKEPHEFFKSGRNQLDKDRKHKGLSC